MKKIKVVGGVILFFVLFYLFRNFFSVWMVAGKYANTNYENSRIAEVPSRADTLILFDDMTFKSSYYGEGTYSLTYSFSGTEIDWVYEHGRAGHNSQMKRGWLGNIEISLVSDLNQYYSKFD